MSTGWVDNSQIPAEDLRLASLIIMPGMFPNPESTSIKFTSVDIGALPAKATLTAEVKNPVFYGGGECRKDS